MTMKALVFDRAGEPEDVLRLRDVPQPTAAPGQALVRVEARSLNPADFSFIRGTYRIRPALPQVAGLVGAGRVVGNGDGVALPIGGRVAFRWPGAWAEWIAVPVERIFVAPEQMGLDDVAQLALNPITAWGLLAESGAQPGQSIGLTAPRSSVAQLVSALARHRGLRPVEIATLAAPLASLARVVLDETMGQGLAALLDSVGGPLVEALFPALSEGASIVAYGTSSPEPIAVRNATLVYSNLTWKGFGIDRWLRSLSPDERDRMLTGLWAGISDGWLRLPVADRVPLDDFGRALRLATAGRHGKVLLMG